MLGGDGVSPGNRVPVQNCHGQDRLCRSRYGLSQDVCARRHSRHWPLPGRSNHSDAQGRSISRPPNLVALRLAPIVACSRARAARRP